MNFRLIAGVALFSLLAPLAQAVDLGRPDVESFIDTMVSQHDYDRETLLDILGEAEKQQSVLDAISRPAEKTLNWSEYRQIFLTPERIDAFVDDAHYFTYINESTGWNAWPYDHPFFLILNVAVGGVWGRAGGPIDDSIFPQRMLVDYARVYRKAVSD